MACDSSAHTYELRIMHYELTNHEWAAIKPMLPDKPRDVPARTARGPTSPIIVRHLVTSSRAEICCLLRQQC